MILEAPTTEWWLGRLEGTGIFGVVLQLDQPSNGDLATRSAKCVSAAKVCDLRTIAHGADTLALAQAAIKAGVDYISGKAIAPPIDALKGAHHWVPPYATALVGEE